MEGWLVVVGLIVSVSGIAFIFRPRILSFARYEELKVKEKELDRYLKQKLETIEITLEDGRIITHEVDEWYIARDNNLSLNQGGRVFAMYSDWQNAVVVKRKELE